jgi:hypothetical protein
MTPHNSQAGKNAPNKSKEGAPPAEHPLRQKDTRKMPTPLDPMSEDLVMLETPSLRITKNRQSLSNLG